MEESQHLVVFSVGEGQFALPLAAVERIVRMVEITPLPKAAEGVLGVINVQGQIVPVIDLRTRFQLATRPLNLSDHLILARTARRTVALVVDVVSGVLECSPGAMTTGSDILPGIEYECVVRSGADMILVHNLDKLLSLEEATTLESVLPIEAPVANQRS
jgi:purine-binding chemotaxis protein CheW